MKRKPLLVGLLACLFTLNAFGADSNESDDLSRQNNAPVYGDSTSPGGGITYAPMQTSGSIAATENQNSCPTQALSWSACGATATVTDHQGQRSLTNTNSGYTGSATATCNNGTWALSGATCSAVQTNADCTGITTGSQGWSSGGESCSGPRTDGNRTTIPHGDTASWFDFPNSNCPNSDNTGQLEFICDDGSLRQTTRRCQETCPSTSPGGGGFNR